jgi:hypothetical protein
MPPGRDFPYVGYHDVAVGPLALSDADCLLEVLMGRVVGVIQLSLSKGCCSRAAVVIPPLCSVSVVTPFAFHDRQTSPGKGLVDNVDDCIDILSQKEQTLTTGHDSLIRWCHYFHLSGLISILKQLEHSVLGRLM